MEDFSGRESGNNNRGMMLRKAYSCSMALGRNVEQYGKTRVVEAGSGTCD
jgi:hypothetical protein